MPMNDPEVLPEEASIAETISKTIQMLLRRRWWILYSFLVVSLLAITVLMLLPNRFTSEATLVVVRQQVSQRYVEPLSITSIAEELNAMKLNVLSRERLMEIIDTFGLYPEVRQNLNPDRLVELMRKQIGVMPIAGGPRNDISAFTVSFTAESPRLAQEVTGRISSLFIEENLRTQDRQASSTTKFLSEQVAAAKQRLEEQEQRLQAFKLSNLGALPEQQQANLNSLTELRIQLQEVSAGLARAQQQRLSLESNLSGQIARLRSEKAALLDRLTPQHPDVQKKDLAIEKTTALLNRLKSGGVGSTGPLTSNLDDPFIAPLEGQVEANIAEFARAPQEEQRLKAQVAQYQARLNLTPVREQQLNALVRDYDLYKRDYTELLDKQLNSELAGKLGEQQGSQHYRLVDPPTLPMVPSSPKRLQLSLAAIVASLGIGLVLAFGRDMLDRSYHSEKELREHLKAPLVVGVPLLMTPAEERSGKLKLIGELAGAGIILLIVLAAEFVVLRFGSGAL